MILGIETSLLITSTCDNSMCVCFVFKMEVCTCRDAGYYLLIPIISSEERLHFIGRWYHLISF